jgi:hypothetical protein
VKFTLDSEDQNSSRPINEHPPLKYNAEEIIKVLLLAEDNKICRVKPSAVTQSATYVIDTRSLQNPEDIKKDDEFGIWRYSGSHPKKFKVYTGDDGHMKVEKCCDSASGNNVVTLRRLQCTHPSNSDFKRLVCFLSGKCTTCSGRGWLLSKGEMI